MDARRWKAVDLLVFELLKNVSTGRTLLRKVASQNIVDKSVLFVPEIEKEIPILQPLDLSSGKPIDLSANTPVTQLGFKLISFKKDTHDKK